MTAPTKVAILTPVFNDWSCIEPFLVDVASVDEIPATIDIFLIDDGSTDQMPDNFTIQADLGVVEVVRLSTNVGHQRAIAAGLVEVASRNTYDVVVIMDADGEDRPQGIAELWQAHEKNPQAIVVAQRGKRTETKQFRASYVAYKTAFRLLTGRWLDFGNFSLIPVGTLNRIILMPELWNHYPATLMRSRVEIVRVPLDRGHRYAGRSRMNFTSLVNHGLAGISVFIDTAFARLLAFTLTLVAVLGAFTAAGLAVRVVTSVPIPGWLALGVTAAFIGLVQVLAALAVLSFLTLSLRSTPAPPPLRVAPDYIADRTRMPKT